MIALSTYIIYTLELLLLPKSGQFNTLVYYIIVNLKRISVLVLKGADTTVMSIHETDYRYMYLPRCKELNKNKVLAVKNFFLKVRIC